MPAPDGYSPAPDGAAVADKDLALHQTLLALVSVGVGSDMVEARIARLEDWPGFVALCRRHRVLSLVAKRLLLARGLPPEVAETLRQDRTQGLFNKIVSA